MKNEPEEDFPYYKLIFLGDQTVGKSSILNRFRNDTYTEDYQASIGLDFQSKIVQIDNKDIHLLLYDTAGQEKFRSLIPMYTRDADIIFLVYDVSNKETFKHIGGWLNELTNINKEEVIIFLVGNNKELIDGRVVSYEEGEKFAKENGLIFQEISARTGEGFSELFYNKLLKEIKNKFKPFEKNSNIKKKIYKHKFEIIKDVKINKENKKGCYN